MLRILRCRIGVVGGEQILMIATKLFLLLGASIDGRTQCVDLVRELLFLGQQLAHVDVRGCDMEKEAYCGRNSTCPVLRRHAVEAFVDVAQARDLLLDLLDLEYESAHRLDVFQGALLVNWLSIDEVASKVVVDALDTLQA